MNRLTQSNLHQWQRSKRSNSGVSEISQFIPSMYILFLIIFFPILNIAALFLAAATQYLATNEFVAKAATQPNYSAALNTMATEAYQFQSLGLAKFLSMSPDGGYTGCGDDLYVVTTEIAAGTVTKSGANQPLTTAVDTTANMYELSVASKYTFAPLIDMSAMPVLGSVPGLGQPVTMTFNASRPVEHPGGLQASASGAGGGAGGASVLPFDRAGIATTATTAPTPDTWRNPAIFKQIQDAGQKVMHVNVINVQASYGPVLGAANGGWVPTGLIVQPGQKVWLDTQATGTWGYPSLGGPDLDANGHNSPGEWDSIDADLPPHMLIGYAGSNPPILPYGNVRLSTNYTITGDPKFIPCGNFLLNYPINFAGPISLACNECQEWHYGSQQVRVIITQ